MVARAKLRREPRRLVDEVDRVDERAGREAAPVDDLDLVPRPQRRLPDQVAGPFQTLPWTRTRRGRSRDAMEQVAGLGVALGGANFDCHNRAGAWYARRAMEPPRPSVPARRGRRIARPTTGVGDRRRRARRLGGRRRSATASSSAPSSASPPASTPSTAATGSVLDDAAEPDRDAARRSRRCCRRSAGALVRARAAGLPRRRLAPRRLGARSGALGRRAEALASLLTRCAAGVGTSRPPGVVGVRDDASGRSRCSSCSIAVAVTEPAPRRSRPRSLYALAYTLRARALAAHVLRERGEARAEARHARSPSRSLALARRRPRRERRVPPGGRVRAPRVGLDPPRPARPVDQQGRRLPAARRARDDACSGSSSCACGSASAGPRQTVGEMIYEVAQTQVAEQGLPHEGDRHAGSRTSRR